MGDIICNLVKNKSNGQLNISLPKKQLSKEFLKDLDKIHKVKIKMKGVK